MLGDEEIVRIEGTGGMHQTNQITDNGKERHYYCNMGGKSSLQL